MTKDAKDNRTNAYTVRYSDIEDALVSRAADVAALETGSWIRMVTMGVVRGTSPDATAGSWQERAVELKKKVVRLEQENEDLRSKLYPAKECMVKFGDVYGSTWMFKPHELVPGHVFRMVDFLTPGHRGRRKNRWAKIDTVEDGAMKTVHAHWVDDVKTDAE